MLDISKNTVNARLKDEVISKNSRVDMSKKRQKNNIDPDGTNLAITKISNIPYEDLQNRITSIQIAREGLENSVSILDKMKELVYSDSSDRVESFNKKRFENLKEKLAIEKNQLENSIKDLNNSKSNKVLNERVNQNEEKVENNKRGHLEFIKSLKSVPDLNSIHKGLTSEKVASLLS